MKSMTKEEIITGLKAAVKPEEEYFIEDDLIDAINQYPEPFELVEPILEIIATNPQVDFGMPGDLVGAIDMFDSYTFVEVPREYGAAVLKAMKNAKIKGKSINVEPANAK